jgi:hypothetical protein
MFFFEAGSYYIAEAALELEIRLSTGITGVHHHTWLEVGCNYDFFHLQDEITARHVGEKGKASKKVIKVSRLCFFFFLKVSLKGKFLCIFIHFVILYIVRSQPFFFLPTLP